MCVMLFPKVNESFTTVYSGGRDRRVWATDLRNVESRTLICEEQAPVLKVCNIFCRIFVEVKNLCACVGTCSCVFDICVIKNLNEAFSNCLITA
jgi:hypothetical protein